MPGVPFETTPITAYPTREAWDSGAIDLVATMLRRWNLTALEPLPGGEAGSVLRVMTRRGDRAVLKVGYPHVEAIHEAVVFSAWAPQLAPRLLRQDPWTWSLLLEEVRPGTPLSQHPVPAKTALAVGADLYARLVQVAAPAGIPRLSTIIDGYIAQSRMRLPEQRDALDAAGVLESFEFALARSRQLAGSGASVLLHGDFNPGNILRSVRGGESRWLTIDAKPMVGDAAFDLWPLIVQLGSPLTATDAEAAVERQLALVAGIVGSDLARAAEWGFCRSAFNISWYLADGNRAAIDAAVREFEVWRRIVGY